MSPRSSSWRRPTRSWCGATTRPAAAIPLAGEGNVLDGIRAERKALAHLREAADQILDTSSLTVHQLKDRLIQMYGTPAAARGRSRCPSCRSASSTASPYDADLVFDLRFLPNPHFVEALRAHDGRDREVTDCALRAPGEPRAAAAGWRTSSSSSSRSISGRARPTSPSRSAAPAASIARWPSWSRCAAFLEGQGLAPIVRHRDLGRE